MCSSDLDVEVLDREHGVEHARVGEHERRFMSTHAIHEPCLNLESLARQRPSAGPAFEKRRWRVNWRPLFSGPTGVALRLGHVAAAPTTLALARVSVWGGLANSIVARMLASTGGFELSSWGHRGRVPPEAAGRAVEALLGDPDAMILAHEAARISFRGADGLLDREQWDQPWRRKLWERLSDAGSRDVEKFARGVRAGRFLVCAVASLEWTIPGLALYGDASLHAWVNEVARELGVELIWTSVEAVHASVDLGLPLASELPLDWGAAVVDASGFNFDQLPATADAEAIDLGDTALVELAPLRAWPKLRKVVLARQIGRAHV